MNARIIMPIIGINIAIGGMLIFVIDDYRIQNHNEKVLKTIMFDCFNWGGSSSGSEVLRFMNGTHFIDNVDCRWIPNDEFSSELK